MVLSHICSTYYGKWGKLVDENKERAWKQWKEKHCINLIDMVPIIDRLLRLFPCFMLLVRKHTKIYIV